MKKSKFYLVFFQVSTLIGIIGFQQLIAYKKLWVIENSIPENEAMQMIRTQKIVVRVIQSVLLITAIILVSQTFHKIKF